MDGQNVLQGTDLENSGELEEGFETLQGNEDPGKQNSEELQGSEGEPQSKDWKSEAAKWKDIAERRAKKLQSQKPSSEVQKNHAPSQDGRLERIEARQENMDLSQEAFDLVYTIAKAKGITLDEAKAQPLVQKALKEQEEEEETKQAIPRSTTHGTQKRAGKSTSEMSREEHKAFAKQQASA